MSAALESVTAQIASACKKAGRDPSSVELIAVSKTRGADMIQPIVDAGQVALGENKLQELEEKAPLMADHLVWHYIGRLQRNKVRKVLQHSLWIHSVDSQKLLEAIDRIAGEEGVKPSLFLQINLEGEESKGGFTPAEASEVVIYANTLINVQIVGLMCIPRHQEAPQDVRPSFRSLRELRDEIEATTQIMLPNLSMGMSNDYPIAIEEGATHVRVGSALFGSRSYPV